MAQFDPQFLDAVLWLLITDVKFMREYGEKIRPDMFEDKVRFLLCSYAQEFYKQSRCVAKQLFPEHVRRRIAQDKHEVALSNLLLGHVAKIAREQKQIAMRYVQERLTEFFEFNHVSGVALVLQRAIDKGDVVEAKRLLQEGSAALRGNGSIGVMRPVDFFAEIHKREMRRKTVNVQEDGVHFMIPTLEQRGVFAHRGELSLIIAPSKRGKSVCLTHVGKCAVFMGHNVLHVSLENPIHMVEDRYEAMFSGLPVNELTALSDMLSVTMSEVKGLARGRLHLLWRMGGTYSPYDLRADIEQLRSDGVRIDTAIVDYMELMKAVGKFSGDAKMRADRGDIAMNLRAVATDTDTTIITAQQTPLKKRAKFRLGMEDGQESSFPSQHSSLIMTLNQTPDELKHSELRLAVDGYWHGASSFGDILLRTDFDRMQFCVEEVPLASGVEAMKAKAGGGTP